MAEVKRALLVSFGPLPASNGKARRLAAALEALGPRLNVDALTAKVEGEPHIERYAGARLLRVPMAGELSARAQTFERALRRQLLGEDYDLVILGDAFGAAAVLQRRAQTPFRLICDGGELQRQLWPLECPELVEEPRVRHRLLRAERQLLLLSDLILSGGAAQDLLLQSLGVSGDRLRRLLPALASAAFAEMPSPNPTPLVVAGLGRGAPWEGFEEALRGICLAREAGTAARLSLAGPFPPTQRQRLRELAEARGHGEALELRGELPDTRIAEFLGAAHAVLSTLRLSGEAASLPLGSHRVAEAMAAGRPVIANEGESARELAGDAACYLAQGTPDEICQTVLRLAGDPAAREAMGARGKERARALFSANSARLQWFAWAGELLDPSGAGLLELSNPAVFIPEGDSPTLSIEPTHQARVAGRDPDTRPMPQPVDEATHIGTSARVHSGSWFRPHLPSDETPI